jgi:DNA-binding NtrC family response regulator
MSVQILVVDDEPDVADLFRQQFRRELRSGRFTMDFALSAAEALERISAVEETRLILIFSDINMPGETGLQLLPKVRALRPTVPVVMITAYGDVDTRRRATEGGAADLVTKPIDFSALRERIDQRLAERGFIT